MTVRSDQKLRPLNRRCLKLISAMDNLRKIGGPQGSMLRDFDQALPRGV